MTNNSKVRILMATYNGDNYLSKQIQSLINQTYLNWELIIRDDGSTDKTCEIIEYFKLKDNRVTLIKDDFGNLRSCQNFSKLMEIPLTDAQYIMFCDQDDIWMPYKIEKSLNALKELEDLYGINKNLMIYGTYQMIDENDLLLPFKSPNYSINPDLKLLLSQNYVYGCTMLINKNLLDISAPIPITAENHDYWIALTASVNNAHIGYINEPLLLYRQHFRNVSGSFTDALLLNRIKRLLNKKEIRLVRNRLKMFSSLSERFDESMPSKIKKLLNGYIKSITKGGWDAFSYSFTNQIGRREKYQTAAFYLNLLRMTKLQ